MSSLQANFGEGMPSLWRPRRIVLCAGLVAASILQTIGAIVLSAVSAALLKGESALYGVPVLGLFGLSALLVLGLFVAQQRYSEQFALSYIHEVRMAYARHALLVPFDVRSPGLGLSLTRLVNDLGAVKLWLSRGLLSLVALGPLVATLGAWVLVFEQSMIWPLLAAALVWIATVVATLPGLRRSIRKSRQKRGGLSLLLGRALPQRLPLLLHGKTEPLLTRLAKRSSETCRYLTQRAVWSGLLKAGCRASYPIAVGVYAVTAGIDADRLVIFLMVFAFLATQLEAGAAGIEYYQANLVAREKLMRVFSLPRLRSAPSTQIQRVNWQATLRISRLRLPSGDVLTETIEPGQCRTILMKDPEDIRHLGLSLAGSTDIPSLTRLSIDGVPFAALSSKEVWRHVALIMPENGLPDYQRKRPAVSLGNRGAPSGDFLEKLSTVLGDELFAHSGDPAKFSEQEALAIRVARAFLRAPSVVVVADDRILTSAEWLERVEDLARSAGTRLVCLRNASEGAFNRDTTDCF